MNVRDGHYPLWGYVHFFTPDRAGRRAVGCGQGVRHALLDRAPRPELLDNIIAASLVPQCAMKVVRTGEEADFTPQTGLQCGCYFDFKTTGKTDVPGRAQTSSDCPADRSACNYGYCEVN